jgi:APA family basic amino acid/polyamine antiporter
MAVLAGDAKAAAASTSDVSPGVFVGLMAALIPVMFAYGGWGQVLWVAGEVRNPGKTLPRATIIGVGVVIAVYLLVNWAYLRLLGVQGVANSEALAADAVGVAWPELGRKLMAGVVAVSAFGVLNVNLLTAPRLVFGMARDGRFISAFGRVSSRFGTPAPAIALIGLLAVALLLAAGAKAVDNLVGATVVVDSVFFALTGAAVLVLRRKRSDVARPMRVPGYPVVPLLFVIGELGAIVGGYLNPEARAWAYVGAAWVAGASIVYWLWFRERR